MGKSMTCLQVRARAIPAVSRTLSLSLALLAGCGGTTEETDTAVAVGPAGGGSVGDVAPGQEVPTEPVVGTGGSVVEPPEAPGGEPTIGIGTDADPGVPAPAEADESP